MKRQFDVANMGLTACSCMYLLVLSKGVYSYTADIIIAVFIKVHSDEFTIKFARGIMESTYKRAKQALPGGDTMK